MQKSYFINTYGCQMNAHESEKIAGILESRNHRAAEKLEDADIIVYNSCCIRATAEHRIYGHLSKLKRIKQARPDIKAVLCGCMPQKPGELELLKKRFPYVDIIIGTHNLNLLGEYLDKAENEEALSGELNAAGKRGHFEVWESERPVCDVPILRTGGLSAFVNIIEGCNNFCTYCIVPYVKGRERSRPAGAVIEEVQGLLDRGFKEITLLGQNVNSYKDGEVSFAGLLGRLNNLSGKFKIKFMTSHPKDLSEDVVRVIADGENLAKCIHLPVQSGSSRVLKLMNRTYTRENYLALIKLIRKYIPDVGLSSDLMVGFPSETEEDFLDSLYLTEEVRFNNLFTFVYNRRSGTKADLMDGQISEDIKTERIERVIKAQFKIGEEDAKKCVGKTYEVLCERIERGIVCGKSWQDRPVYFSGGDDCLGQFVKVKVTFSKNTKLYGEMVKE